MVSDRQLRNWYQEMLAQNAKADDAAAKNLPIAKAEHLAEMHRFAALVQAEWAFRQAGLYIDLGADAAAVAWPEDLR